MVWAGDNYPQEYIDPSDEEGPTDDEIEAMRKAWVNYPGRITNDDIHKDFRAGFAAGRDHARAEQAAEIERLREQLRIATDLLERLAAQRGLDMRHPGEHATLAEDALIQMSVVDPGAPPEARPERSER